MVVSAEASLYSGAAAARPTLYAPASRPVVPNSNERPWLVGWPLIDQDRVAFSGHSPVGVTVTESPLHTPPAAPVPRRRVISRLGQSWSAGTDVPFQQVLSGGGGGGRGAGFSPPNVKLRP